MDSQDGIYARRPWELTSQTLELYRREQADDADQWYPPVMPSPDALLPGLPGAREQVRAAMVPPEYGYRTAELTIDDILNDVYSRLQGSHVNDAMPTGFSGQQGGYEATMRPTGAGGGGIT
jgi:hypothetical protein